MSSLYRSEMKTDASGNVVCVRIKRTPPVVTDGQLTVGLTALGGTYNNALINSLIITPTV